MMTDRLSCVCDGETKAGDYHFAPFENGNFEIPLCRLSLYLLTDLIHSLREKKGRSDLGDFLAHTLEQAEREGQKRVNAHHNQIPPAIEKLFEEAWND